ncbi:MAG: aromatic ring-hydroxylating dioxygenase subunit alpha [Porticoccaceae bacterium]|nr:aromatic ring-hydroxylating dioxygenase subunit alpha [Porticoccaceae bacterium]
MTNIPAFAMNSPGPSVQEILEKTNEKVPYPLDFESYKFLGTEDIDFSRYTSREFFQKEMDKMWSRVWQWACREEHIPEPGDYTVYDVGQYSIVVVRTDEGSIKAFYNSCLHRGTKFFHSDTQGAVSQLTCPFHGWTWNLDGSLKKIPNAWDFEHVKAEDLHLPELKVETWGGFVFINMDPDAKPLKEYIAPLDDHFKRWNLADRYIAVHVQKELPCNWKAAAEAFLENYHTQTVHPQLIGSSSSPSTQYDILGDHLSRFYNLTTVPDPVIGRELSEQERLDMALVGDGSMNNPVQVPEGGTARNTLAEMLRKQFAAMDIEVGDLTDAEIIDTMEYTLFPNMFLFPGLSLPMIYRFRPLGMDPDKSLFDLIFLRPVPRSGERPSPPEPIRIGIEDSYTTVPELDPGMAEVYDQDTNNMGLQQLGFYTAKKRGQTLGNYQEVRIRHLHATVDRYLED